MTGRGSDRARRGSLLTGSTGGVWVALASTVIVFAALALIIVNSSGWPAVKHTFFDPAEFRAYFKTIGHAFVLNIKIFLVAEVLILILAMVLAVLRQRAGPGVLPDPGCWRSPTPICSEASPRSCWCCCSGSAFPRCISPTSPSIRCTWEPRRWW